MFDRKELKGKTIEKVQLSISMASIFCTDGSIISVAYDGDQLNMCLKDGNGFPDFVMYGLDEDEQLPVPPKTRRSTMQCCGKRRRTRFCADCGREIAPADPAQQLLDHCLNTVKVHQRTVERKKKLAATFEKGDHPHSAEEATAEAGRAAELVQKWQQWAKRLSQLIETEKKGHRGK